MPEKLMLSPLGHTWILDLDGTILRHNGHLSAEGDTLLPGVSAFMAALPPDDMVVLLTSRSRDLASQTEAFLRENGIRFDHIIYGAPFGERILVNDAKPSGLATAHAVCGQRDSAFPAQFEIDNSL